MKPTRCTWHVTVLSKWGTRGGGGTTTGPDATHPPTIFQNLGRGSWGGGGPAGDPGGGGMFLPGIGGVWPGVGGRPARG